VLQSSEGRFLSVGTRRFRLKRSVTPPLTPISVAPPEKVPVAMPANMLTERTPPRVRSSKFSTLPAATDKIVISRNVLLGLCLTTFAFGIVTTLTIDHLHARASEAPMLREAEPVVLQTTPIEPPANAPSSAPSEPPPSPVVQPKAAAAEAVVVQLPPVAEKSVVRPIAHLPPSTVSHGARSMAAGPIRTAPPTASATTAFHRRMSKTAQSDSSSASTEATPDETSAMPAPTTKKWVDPFDQ
jgi:hypothetical protein